MEHSDLSKLCDRGKDFLKQLFQVCGEDATRQGLVDTPRRFVKSFLELTQGYHLSADEVLNDALFDCDNPEPVIVRDIPFFSLCEHHLLPFFGHCTITYLPNKKVIGLLKIYRIVDMFSRRLQIQERLTHQSAETLFSLTQAKGVRVEMQAEHMCVAMRGVCKVNTRTYTSSRLGLDCPLTAEMPHALTFGLQQSIVFRTKEFAISLGCTSEEKQRLTPICFQVEIKFDKPVKACSSDALQDTVCYDHLSQLLYESCQQKHFNLIEHCGYEAYQSLHAYLQQTKIDAALQIKLTKKLQHPLLTESMFIIGDF